MKKALIAITQGGMRTAQKINGSMECDLYTLAKFADAAGVLPIDQPMADFMAGIFSRYREIIMIMSCGIAVRSIAPHLKSKLSDPAVVVLDEKGQHVISLLSGHLGGANLLAHQVAGITGGQAVITTASDTLGMLSVDMLAKANDLVMTDMEQVKRVTAAMVNGEKVVVVREGWSGQLDGSLDEMTWNQVKADPPAGVIFIGHQPPPDADQLGIPVAQLLSRSLVIGIGCRLDTDPEKLWSAVTALFAAHKLSLSAVELVATVDVKKDEPAVLQLAARLAVPLQIIGREEIATVESAFACSDFVRATIGVGCVAEPVAYLSSGCGRCLIAKSAGGGITLAVYEKKRPISRSR